MKKGCHLEPPWQATHKGDVRAREMADRHYTRQSVGHPMWTRPGYNFVLFAPGGSLGNALWCWWRPKWEAGQERFDKLRTIECTMFRNEGPWRSSDLIVAAVAALETEEARTALALDAAGPVAMLVTGIGSKQTARRRSKRALPGACYRAAGWVDLEHKKGRADVWLTRSIH